LAKTLALSCGLENVDERGREAAAAEIDLLRIRKLRTWLLETLSLEAKQPGSSPLAEVNNKLARLERYERRAYIDAGGLMAYTVDLAELLRRMARDVQEVLNGAKPGDIPIYQPTKFELLINQKTAKVLGLALPPSLLSRVDEMIE
jgi:hypothetical protein